MTGFTTSQLAEIVYCSASRLFYSRELEGYHNTISFFLLKTGKILTKG
jgi:hypothetical protein